jgi:LacI family transcriptional regulator
VFQGVEAQAKKLGYNVLVSYLYSKQDEERQLSAIFQNTMGVILLGTEFEESSSWLTHHYQIHNSDVPLVMIDNMTFNMEIDCICTDNYRGAYKAIKYLIGQGHRSIGYFSSAQRIANFDERKAGVLRAIDEHPHSTLTVVPVGFSSENAYHDVCEWLGTINDLPTAFFTDSDNIAFGAIRAFRQFGYNIPKDISIIGFDDMPACSIVNPSLTTIRVEKELLGCKAVEMLHQRILEKSDIDMPELTSVFRTRLSTDVVERHSVNIPRIQS